MAKYSRNEAKDAAKERIRGIFTAPCLPETPDGEIDEAGLRRDIRYYLDVIKVGGLYIHGFYGNFWLLTVPERKRVIEIVVDEVKGRVPIMCRCAHACLKDTIDMIKHAEAVGADFISLIGPWLARGSEAMIVEYFERIAAETNLGLSIFNTAQAGYIISPQLMARLAKIPNVAALKNHVSQAHTIEVRKLAGDDIVVINPEEEDFLVSATIFGQKAIYTGTNMMFDSAKATPMKNYFDAVLRNEYQLATELYYKMQPLRDLHHKWVSVPWMRDALCPISTIKWWTQQLGLTGGPSRPPLQEISEQQKQALLADLIAIGLVDAKAPVAAR